MTVIQALKQTVDDGGNIVIPISQYKGETEIPGTVSETWLRAAFGTQLDQTLPLTQAKFDALKNTIQGQWQDNWQWYCDNNVITVA